MPGLSSGRTLGERFTLIRPLRPGGATEVWLVRDEVLGERMVAKILPPSAAPEQVALLERECRQARRLVHPNIVRVYDLHRSDGYNFITMAWVDGDDLRTRRGRSPAEIVRVLQPVADALAYAHAEGVIHRDLKASNILCDASGRPYLLDFGIAGTRDAAEELKLVGGGSRHSVSPQQLAGAEPAPSDDIYALGVLVHELIEGRPPFWPDITERCIRNEVPDPPRSNHRLPPPLLALVAGMLEKSATDRPRDMATVKRKLAEIAEQLPGSQSQAEPAGVDDVRLTPPPRIPPIRPIATHEPREPRAAGSAPHRRVVFWSVVAAFAIAGLIAFNIYFLPGALTRLRADAAVATPPVPQEREQPREVVPPGSGDSGAVHFRRQAESSLGRAVELLDSLDEKAAKSWAAEEYRAAETLVVAGDDHLTGARYREARDAYDEAVERMERLESRSLDVLQQTLDEGQRALADGDSVRAVGAFELALRIAPGNPSAAAGLTRAGVLDPLMELLRSGVASERSGRLDEAERSYRQAVDLDPMSQQANQALARVQGRLSEDAFAGEMSDGLGALGRGEYQAALEAFRRADALRPGTAEVADGLAQAEQSLRLEAISLHRGKASELEAAEQWSEAAEQFAAVLELDPTIRFAQAGRDRCLERASLDARITFHLGHPGRLSSDSVFAEAIELLDEASAIEPAGPRHQEQIRRLDALLEVAGERISILLESDNLTEVTVYKVGKLGTFTRRELALRPGRYTVVGSRRGYRDVRTELVVEPGRDHAPLIVRCEEKV